MVGRFRRNPRPEPDRPRPAETAPEIRADHLGDLFPDGPARTVLTFTLPSEEGNERIALARVAEAVAPLGLPKDRIERLKTAVAEATMNAIEHGNENRAELAVEISVLTDGRSVLVRIRDQGGGRPLLAQPLPNLDAKLAGLQSPRGWGLFLIGQMVDELRTESDDQHNIIELEMRIAGPGKETHDDG